MQKLKLIGVVLGVGIILWLPAVLAAQDTVAEARIPGVEARIPKGVYLKLTQDFYEALKNEGLGSTKIYTTDPANEYLKQIAISAKFMVETNLEIIKQQARMNELLNSLLKGKRKISSK